MIQQKSKEEILKGAHTRELMKWRNESYASGTYWYADYKYTTDEIKTELATREHIPNKQESKALRQAAAKRKT